VKRQEEENEKRKDCSFKDRAFSGLEIMSHERGTYTHNAFVDGRSGQLRWQPRKPTLTCSTASNLQAWRVPFWITQSPARLSVETANPSSYLTGGVRRFSS
jgi:hypothetical protein